MIREEPQEINYGTRLNMLDTLSKRGHTFEMDGDNLAVAKRFVKVMNEGGMRRKRG